MEPVRKSLTKFADQLLLGAKGHLLNACWLLGCSVLFYDFILRPLSKAMKGAAKNLPRIASKKSQSLKQKYDAEWAIVVGGLDLESGMAICHSLAAQGLNIILVGKKYERLVDFSLQIEKQYPGVKTSIFAYDLNHLDNEIEARRFKEILTKVVKDHKKLKILVNNVGICGEGIPGMLNFHTQPLWNIFNVLNVHLNTLNIVTHHILNQWYKELEDAGGVDHITPKPLGCVITFSTLAALTPQQILPVFCASKRYGYELNKSIAEENPMIDFVVVTQRSSTRPKKYVADSFAKIPAQQSSSSNLAVIAGGSWVEDLWQPLWNESYLHKHLQKSKMDYYMVQASKIGRPGFYEQPNRESPKTLHTPGGFTPDGSPPGHTAQKNADTPKFSSN